MNVGYVRWVAGSALAGLIFGGVVFAIVRPVLAQIDATSTDIQIATSSESSQGDATTTTDILPIAESEPLIEASSAAPDATTTVIGPIEAAPEGLTEVKIIGTKYTDYFTDGVTEFAFPGDPKIDDHLSEPDAAVPAHEGLSWV